MFTYNNSKFLGIYYIIEYTILNFSELLYNYTKINTHIKKIKTFTYNKSKFF